MKQETTDSKVSTIKGISSITNRPFDNVDKSNFGWMISDRDFSDKYGRLDAFDYADLFKHYKEFKHHNPEITPKPQSEVERLQFKTLKEANVFSKD